MSQRFDLHTPSPIPPEDDPHLKMPGWSARGWVAIVAGTIISLAKMLIPAIVFLIVSLHFGVGGWFIRFFAQLLGAG